MKRAIPVEELDEETRQRLNLKIDRSNEIVGERLVNLGKVLRGLKGLTNRDALWVLEQARWYIDGHIGDVPIDYDEDANQGYIPPLGYTIQLVAQTFGLKPTDLKQRRRNKEIVIARHVAMYILWLTDKYTLTAIGEALGGRSPATIGHGFQKVAKLIKGDPVLNQIIVDISSKLMVAGRLEH